MNDYNKDFGFLGNMSAEEAAGLRRKSDTIPYVDKDVLIEWLTFERIVSCFPDVFKNEHNKKFLCPFHEEKTPSLSINKEKRLFQCFGCGKKGNFISLYGYLKNPNFSSRECFDAAREYYISNDPFACHVEPHKPLKRQTPNIEHIPFDKHPKDHDEIVELFALIHSKLGLSDPAYNYLSKERALSNETIHKYQIRSMGNAFEFLYCDENISNDLLLKHSLIYSDYQSHYSSNFPSDCIVFPHYLENQIYYLSNRIIKPISGTGKIKNIPKMQTKFFAGDRDMKQFDTVYLFEGVLNALSFYELTEKTNFYACLGKPSPKSVDLLLQQYKKVCLALDNDEAGLNATQNILNCYLTDPNSYSNIKPENICTLNYQKYYQKYNIPLDSTCDMNDILKISKGIQT